MGTIANSIANNATRLGNLTKAGYPENLFMANPTVAGGGAFLVANDGSSFYDAMQVEWRRRMTRGISLQGSYVWSHSISNGATISSVRARTSSYSARLRVWMMLPSTCAFTASGSFGDGQVSPPMSPGAGTV